MSETIEARLIDYLKAVAGDRPWVEAADRKQTLNLPLFLRERYRICRADLFGRKFNLAIEKRRTDESSPAGYAQDAVLLKERLSGDVILVLSKISSYGRNRLVRQHIAFIVPGTQMFLPMLMIDLREQYPKSRTSSEKNLSTVAQLIIIHHLLREPLDDIPLGQVAHRLGYSAMALSKAQDELHNTHLCEAVRSGKTVSIHFKLSGRTLWESAEPLLQSPVRRTQWIRWGRIRARAVVAGITALSTYTMLADDAIPTYAMRDRQVVEALENGQIVGCGGSEEAEARMESWKYDPWLLAEGGLSDPCSLYLTLRHSADERVQKELASLLTGVLR
jgi:hypothetical protein